MSHDMSDEPHVVVKAVPRGPLALKLTGGCKLTLIGTDGEPIDLDGRERVRLCRCGGSSTAPFCDGTHNRNAFEAPQG